MNNASVVSKNLGSLDREMSSVCERRVSHIYDLAKILITGSAGESEFPQRLELMREILRETENENVNILYDKGNPIAENQKIVGEALYSLYAHDKIILCRALCDFSDVQHSPDEFFSQEQSNNNWKVSYLKNVYTDSAYRIFSETIPDLTVTYCEDFNIVCEDVYYGRSGACILPIENTSEGKFSAFRSLIGKYDLKIVLTCPVLSADGSTVTRFALCRKNLEKLKIERNIKKTPMFEFTLTVPHEKKSKICTLGDILTAAECFGLALCKVDSLPVTYTDVSYAYDLIFYTDNSRLDCFLYYLNLEAPQFTAVGLYYHLM